MTNVTPARQYRTLYEMIKMIPTMIRIRRKRVVSKDFFERIMLAVTEVNGCDVCSYGHTKMALEIGMTESEIREILSGELSAVPNEDLTGVLFAQHYAESEGKPSKETWKRLNRVYGEEKSIAILAVTRTIMFGNFYGIPLSNILRRLKGQKAICIAVELLKELTLIPFLPIALLHNLWDMIARTPIIRVEDLTLSH